ncbi:HAUS augmin-like complex subunit 5 [Gopherus evgoodei]|uniref:HAUS augmin-like complex subunit 5 n=1 Tax=Gopherus evgoodei TaxID=1825980 RepID=UPI0011CF681A|nr:HAUS augmin-like complex subunit 5 [Gopherus evgoodei]
MERGGPALELKLWAAQEMGLPPVKVPPDGAFRRGLPGGGPRADPRRPVPLPADQRLCGPHGQGAQAAAGQRNTAGRRLEQLQDISRKAKVELTVGGKVPDLGFAGMEPEVLPDVRTACQLRFHFLKLLFKHSTSGAFP